MPLSLEQYKEAWNHTQPSGGWCSEVTPETAVLDKSFRSSMMGDGFVFVDDFGHAVGYCRGSLLDDLQPPPRAHETEREAELTSAGIGVVLPGLQMMEDTWRRHVARFGADELTRRWTNAEAGFDQILEQFVREGYRPELGKQLLAVVNANSIDLELYDVYVLPGDLDRLLERTGNPLVDPDEEDEALADANAPIFDLSNPEHRDALAERMNEMAQ